MTDPRRLRPYLLLASAVLLIGCAGSEDSGGSQGGSQSGASGTADGGSGAEEGGGPAGGSGAATSMGATDASDTSLDTDGPGGTTTDGLDEGEGCGAVFNPDQLVDFHFTLDPGDWQAIQADLTYSQYYPAVFQCDDGDSLMVGLRRKRSGGTEKVGLKVDINLYVAGQKYFGLKKLNLENGISSGGDGPSSIGALVQEYLAWRMMVLSRAYSSRASFIHVHVNGESYGAYVNVEQVDKVFLSSRLTHDAGWLWKKSGGAGDGQKTNEGAADPFADYFCFWTNGGNSCLTPSASELAQTLPDHLHLDQILRMGGVNALMANTDSPLIKDNNYYFYDYDGGRVYFAWDLDTAMKQGYDVFTGGAGGSTGQYRDVLFSNWEDDYDQILTGLLGDELTLAAINAEIDRVVEVAAPTLDSDPWVEQEDTTQAVVEALSSWWSTRHAEVQAQLDAH